MENGDAGGKKNRDLSLVGKKRKDKTAAKERGGAVRALKREA